MKKKLLVMGISGLTGFKIANAAKSSFDVYGTYNTRKTEIENCTFYQLDITKSDALKTLFFEIKPDYVINTTAVHNVDYCEEHEDESFNVNSDAVNNLRIHCDHIGAKLVHISTDYVFDGKIKRPYSENDVPIPISTYGKSKLSGEQHLKNTIHSVIRPSVVYGWTPLELAGTVSSSGKPMNFAMWLLTKLHSSEKLKIVTDQYASATLADSLADSAINLVKNTKSGIFHISGLSCESRYEFSCKLAAKFGYDPNLIQTTDSSQFKQKANRPSYSCLDCTKAINEFDLQLHTTEQALEVMKKQVEIDAPYLISK